MCILSVIIPFYNEEKYISQAIESILVQPIKDIEIILVNDGSTDSSKLICEKYVQKYSNIQLINQENQGVSVARNIGIDNATGEYIQFLDGDDYYIEGALSEELKKVLDEKLVDVYIFSSYRANKKRNRFCYDMRFNNQLLPGHRIYTIGGTFGSCIIKRSLLNRHQIRFDKGIKLNEDKVFKVKALYFADVIQTTDKFCYVYCNTEGSIMHYTHLYEHDRVKAWKLCFKWFEQKLCGEEKRIVLSFLQMIIYSKMLQVAQMYVEAGHSKRELFDELEQREELEILQNLGTHEVFPYQINDLKLFQTNIDKFVRIIKLNKLKIRIGRIILLFPYLRTIRENRRYPLKDTDHYC